MFRTYQSHRKIHIPEPCHEDWNQMTPADKGKFCDACCKVVVDFTAKSPLEIQQILKDQSGQKMCGHFRSDQIVHPAVEVIAFRNNSPARAHPLRKLVAAAIFLAFGAGLFSCTTSNHKPVRTQSHLIETLYAVDRSDEMHQMLVQMSELNVLTLAPSFILPPPPEPVEPGGWGYDGMVVMGDVIEPPIDIEVVEPPTPTHTSNQEDEVLSIVEHMPTFPGGDEQLYKALSKRVEYPQEALEAGIEGTVYVEFVVTRQGEIENTHVLRGIGAGCDESAVAAIEALPAWNPGQQRGVNVNVRMVLPIRFRLD